MKKEEKNKEKYAIPKLNPIPKIEKIDIYPTNVTSPPRKTDSEKQIEEHAPKKRSVILMIFLSIITIGIYPCFWYINRVKEFNNLYTKDKIKKGEGLTYLIAIFYIFFLIFALTYRVLARDPYVNDFQDILNLTIPTLILFLLFMILLLMTIFFMLHLSFKTRKIINEALVNKGTKTKISWVFTLIFNLFYLQY